MSHDSIAFPQIMIYDALQFHDKKLSADRSRMRIFRPDMSAGRVITEI